MSLPLSETIPGAFAVVLVLFAILAVVITVWHEWRKRRDEKRKDEMMRRAFKNADRFGLIGRDWK